MNMSQSFAQRLAKEVDPQNTPAQVQRAFELAYGRVPDPTERSAAEALIEQHGLRAFCRAVLNSSELIYVN
jgi:hypothetical protein